jgi:hypothetical protein
MLGHIAGFTGNAAARVESESSEIAASNFIFILKFLLHN